MVKFSDVKIGDDVKFYALIESMQKRFTPNKSGYYGATLSDGDTSIDARIWDCNLIESNDVTVGIKACLKNSLTPLFPLAI